MNLKISLLNGEKIHNEDIENPSTQLKLRKNYVLGGIFKKAKCLCSEKCEIELTICFNEKHGVFYLRKSKKGTAHLHSEDCFFSKEYLDNPSQKNVSDWKKGLHKYLTKKFKNSEIEKDDSWVSGRKALSKISEKLNGYLYFGASIKEVIEIVPTSVKDQVDSISLESEIESIVVAEIYKASKYPSEDICFQLKGVKERFWLKSYNANELSIHKFGLEKIPNKSLKVFAAMIVKRNKNGNVNIHDIGIIKKELV